MAIDGMTDLVSEIRSLQLNGRNTKRALVPAAVYLRDLMREKFDANVTTIPEQWGYIRTGTIRDAIRWWYIGSDSAPTGVMVGISHAVKHPRVTPDGDNFTAAQLGWWLEGGTRHVRARRFMQSAVMDGTPNIKRIIKEAYDRHIKEAQQS